LGIENQKPKKNSLFSSRQQLQKIIIINNNNNYFFERPCGHGQQPASARGRREGRGGEGRGGREGGREGWKECVYTDATRVFANDRRVHADTSIYPQVTS
jgi:hypothetical protein